MHPNLKAALDPASVALIGASENPNKIGGRPLDYLQRFGFRGAIYPINPKRTEVQGVKAVPRLVDLDSAPNVAIIAVPGDDAVRALDECGTMGVKLAVMMTSGFGETGPEGKAAERAMVERARARGMRMIGPNTQGLANFGTGAVLSFSSMFLEEKPQDGPVGIVSQSGAMSVIPYGLLRSRGIGVRHAHATGNDADVTACEFATAVASDPELKLLLLYLESIPDPEHLAEAAAIGRSRNLPIIALKSGRTPAGQATASSHTGALANEDRVVDAFLEQHGIWRAKDSVDLVRAAELYLQGWKPEGRRLVVISNSGATCVLAADAATSAEMEIPRLSEDTQTRLSAILPGFAATANPVDITAALLTNSALFSQILPVIAEDPGADAFLVGVPVAGQAYDVEAFGRDTAAFAAATGKPVVVTAPQAMVAAPFKSRGLPVFAGEAEAVSALRQFIGHQEMIARAGERLGSAASFQSYRDRQDEASPPRLLDEAESLAHLAAAGVPTVSHRLCRSADEAVTAAETFGGPVVVKGCSPDVAHKSELGLVHLGLRSLEAVRGAFEACRASLATHGATFSGVLVAPMAKGRRELLLGAHRDPFFGPVILVGDGGKYVEAMPDTCILLPPFTERDVRDALARLRIAPVLAGTRGEPPMALEGYVAAALALGRLMTEPGSRIASVDINPFLVGTGNEEGMALDAVVLQHDGRTHDETP
jgi:acyl-CoA synthetase (NDP forming)